MVDGSDDLKQGYRIFKENKEAVKEINQSNKEIVDELAEKFQVKPKEIRDAFRFAKELEESGHDALDSIVDVFTNLQEARISQEEE